MICKNGHEIVERKLLSGAMRCPVCHLESGRRREQRRREREKAGLPRSGACPYCQLVPCRCEAL